MSAAFSQIAFRSLQDHAFELAVVGEGFSGRPKVDCLTLEIAGDIECSKPLRGDFDGVLPRYVMIGGPSIAGAFNRPCRPFARAMHRPRSFVSKLRVKADSGRFLSQTGYSALFGT